MGRPGDWDRREDSGLLWSRLLRLKELISGRLKMVEHWGQNDKLERLVSIDGLFDLGTPRSPMPLLWSLDGLRNKDGSRKVSKDDIFDLVHIFRETDCFDRHDRVYALLSLERWSPRRRPIVADYAMGVPQMLMHVLDRRLIDGGREGIEFPRFFDEVGLREEEEIQLLSLLREKAHDKTAPREWKALYNHLRGMLDPARRNVIASAPTPRNATLQEPLSATNSRILINDDPVSISDDDVPEEDREHQVREQVPRDPVAPLRETLAGRVKRWPWFRTRNSV